MTLYDITWSDLDGNTENLASISVKRGTHKKVILNKVLKRIKKTIQIKSWRTRA